MKQKVFKRAKYTKWLILESLILMNVQLIVSSFLDQTFKQMIFSEANNMKKQMIKENNSICKMILYMKILKLKKMI